MLPEQEDSEAVASHCPDSRIAPLDLERLREKVFIAKRTALLEERWATRHPLFACMLDWPVCGASLRQRRRRYVERMFDVPLA